jgi:hypothetical protein
LRRNARDTCALNFISTVPFVVEARSGVHEESDLPRTVSFNSSSCIAYRQCCNLLHIRTSTGQNRMRDVRARVVPATCAAYARMTMAWRCVTFPSPCSSMFPRKFFRRRDAAKRSATSCARHSRMTGRDRGARLRRCARARRRRGRGLKESQSWRGDSNA